MDEREKARDYEKSFRYGTGLIPTPVDWTSRFWEEHRRRIVEAVEPCLKSHGPALFLGIGGGDVLPLLKGAHGSVYGIDINVDFIRAATPYCSCVAADGSTMPFKDSSFGLVVCNMVLHHIIGQGGLERTIRECGRVLRPGGTLLIFEPNLFHPSGLLLTLLNKFHLYNAVGGGSDYEYALSPLRLKRLCFESFRSVEVESITMGHPRFPLFMQKAIMSRDRALRALYPLSFSFSIKAVKA